MTAARDPSGPFAELRAGGESGTVRTSACSFAAVADICDFLPLRRKLGYAAAESVVTTVAERLHAALPELTLGRIGRTTVECAFVATDPQAATAALTRASAALAEPLLVDGLRLVLRIAIGAVHLGDGAFDDAAIDLAATAAADAHRAHRGYHLVDAADQHEHALDDFRLLRDLPEAIESGALQLHYQPKLGARSNRIESAEALLRWRHPVFGAVPIERLIRAAEETGAIGELTEWAIARAIADHADLAAGGCDLPLYVNMSGCLLPDSAFTKRVLAAMAGSTGKIGFEITETAVIVDPDRAIHNLHAFSDAGIRIAIDDYGSGLSSMAYLKRLPAQELKIDREFIKDLTQSHRDPLLVRSTIELAHALEMEVTAEGVDDPMALALLRIMGCDLMQGYLISPALPPAELQHFLADDARLEALRNPVFPGMWANPESQLTAR